MKARMLSLITFLTLILIVFTLVVATGENGYTPKKNEEYYGIWINPEYNTRTFKAKTLFKPDGTWYSYSMTTKDSWVGTGEFNLTSPK